MLAVFGTDLIADDPSRPVFYRHGTSDVDVEIIRRLVNVPDFTPRWTFIATWPCIRNFGRGSLVKYD